MNDGYVNVNYEDLNEELLEKENSKVFKIHKNDAIFYFNLDLTKKSDRLLIFSNGAIDRAKKAPPVFMRRKWKDQVDANCIFIDDPTIHGTNLSIGWGVGRPHHHYLKSISEILVKISKLRHLEEKNIVYYGSSAGGTMSIMLSTFHRGTTALVNNPQALTTHYLNGAPVRSISKALYNNLSKEELEDQYGSRFSIVDCFIENDYIPNIYYLYNRACRTDYEKQFLPLIQNLKDKNISAKNIHFKPYNNRKLGHNPLSKGTTLKWIRSVYYRLENNIQ